MGHPRYDDESPLSVVGALLLGLAVLMLGVYLLNTWYPTNVSSEPRVVWKSGMHAHGLGAHALRDPMGYLAEPDLKELFRNPAVEAARQDVTVINVR